MEKILYFHKCIQYVLGNPSLLYSGLHRGAACIHLGIFTQAPVAKSHRQKADVIKLSMSILKDVQKKSIYEFCFPRFGI